MRFNVIGYLIGEGFRNVFKNKKSTISSLMIMCATMIIFGVFFMIGENVNHIIKDIEEAQGIEVFIKNEATDEQVQALGEQLRSLEYVNNVEFISKEQALNRFKERLKENSHVLSIYENNNIFPASYIVTLTDLSKSDDVQEKAATFENVKNIQSSDQTISTLLKIANAIRIATGIFLVFLIIVSIFIISNTIKLTVHARRKEISIMKYVGATNSFIRWPFMVEGIIIGIVAALISILLVGVMYNFVSAKIMQSSVTHLINITLLGFSDMFTLIIIVYVLLGIGIGIIGSAISMRKYLEV